MPKIGPVLEENKELLQVVYQTLSTRRLGYDNLMWQVPVLSLAAQAFLYTIALSNGNSNAARIISSVLALIISLMSIQLMSKHRFNEEVDSRILEEIEKSLKVEVSGFYPHQKTVDRAKAVNMKANGFIRLSSYRVWMFGLSLFAITAITIIVITVLNLALL